MEKIKIFGFDMDYTLGKSAADCQLFEEKFYFFIFKLCTNRLSTKNSATI